MQFDAMIFLANNEAIAVPLTLGKTAHIPGLSA
jgi:hypothetical protein